MDWPFTWSTGGDVCVGVVDRGGGEQPVPQQLDGLHQQESGEAGGQQEQQGLHRHEADGHPQGPRRAEAAEQRREQQRRGQLRRPHQKQCQTQVPLVAAPV